MLLRFPGIERRAPAGEDGLRDAVHDALLLQRNAAPAVGHQQQAVARADAEHVANLLGDDDLSLGADFDRAHKELRFCLIHPDTSNWYNLYN